MIDDSIKVKEMAPGEYELRKAFEDVIRMNVDTIIQYSRDTRDMVRDLEKEVGRLRDQLLSRGKEVNLLKSQLANIQQTLYARGTTSGE